MPMLLEPDCTQKIRFSIKYKYMSAGTSSSQVETQIYRPPIAANNRRANLFGSLPLLRELIGEDRLLLADIAFRSMRAREAIEQALVPRVPVAITVARLLVQNRPDFRGQRIDIPIQRIGKLLRIERGRKRRLQRIRVVRGNP